MANDDFESKKKQLESYISLKRRAEQTEITSDIKARMQNIEIAIDSLEDIDESVILWYRYVDGIKTPVLAEMLNYTERHTYRIINTAIHHLNIPKHVSECQ